MSIFPDLDAVEVAQLEVCGGQVRIVFTLPKCIISQNSLSIDTR